MAEFHFITTAKHHGASVALPGDRIPPGADGMHPPLTKNGFRKVFWQVFSEARTVLTPDVAVTWLGEPLTVTGAWYFRARPSELTGTEGDDIVAVFRVSSPLERESLPAMLDTARDGVERLERRMLDAWVTALHGTPYADGLDEVEHGANKPAFKPALDGWSATTDASIPFLLAFYYFALTVAFRIERAQADIDIPAIADRLDPTSMEAIALSRLRLIDYDRRFLTMNLSASPEVEGACLRIAERLRLREQHARMTELAASMETHLSNVSQIAQERTARSTGRAINVLAFLGIPLSIFSTFAGLSLDSGFPVDPAGIATRPAFGWLWLLSFAFPLLVMATIVLLGRAEVARLKSRR